MLAVSPLMCKNERQNEEMVDDFPDFGGANLLDSIDFDDLLVGINVEDFLPDLEMDPHILAEFSLSDRDQESQIISSDYKIEDNYSGNEEVVDKANSSASDGGSGSTLTQLGEDVVSKRDNNKSSKEGHEKGRKSSSQSKNPHGKRKVKVDWTPELHRRFVQAVEQLGVNKAVPSRILDLMGIDCLTRHNIASHLQKYRSHRKHLLAKEAEAANWTHRRQMYGGTTAPAAAAGVIKRDMNPWIAPTMGFPPVAPLPHFRPLHVWGHPSVDHSLMHMWPKHLTPSPPPPPPAWTPAATVPAHPPPPPPADPAFWHSAHQRVPNGLTPGTPCFPPHLTPARFPGTPVPTIPPHPMYKVDLPGINGAPGQAVPHPPLDFQPSKESIDAAIGDVLSKPWLPLPLGLKPPSVDGVLVELQRQGVPKIPPVCV